MVRNDDGSPGQVILPDEVAAARPFDGEAGGAERLLDGLERLRLHVFSIMSLGMSLSARLAIKKRRGTGITTYWTD